MTEVRMRTMKKVPARPVIMALLLLAGVLAMAYGYFADRSAVLYAGIAVTGIAALNAVIFSVISPNFPRTPLRRR